MKRCQAENSNFAELTDSIKEAGQIKRGEIGPARRTKIRQLDAYLVSTESEIADGIYRYEFRTPVEIETGEFIQVIAHDLPKPAKLDPADYGMPPDQDDKSVWI